jgi:TonB family protein
LDAALKEADAALKINDHFSAAWLLKTQTLLRLFTDRSYAAGKKSGSGQEGSLFQDDEERYEHYKLMAEAAASLESYLKFNQDTVINEFWREQLDAMRFYIEWAGKKGTDPHVLSGNKNLKPTIKYVDRAKYTDEARQAGVKGKAILRVEFAADGQLKHVLVLQGLSHGLTQEVVRAARKMKFIPAMKDGQAISVISNIEFDFSLY